MTQNINQNAIQGIPTAIPTFSLASSKAVIPTQFKIQNTTKLPFPYRVALWRGTLRKWPDPTGSGEVWD